MDGCVVAGGGSDGVLYDFEKERELWLEAAGLIGSGAKVSVTVYGWNRGGLLVTWRGLRGFVPYSQCRGIEVDSREAVERLVGSAIWVGVLECDGSRGVLKMGRVFYDQLESEEFWGRVAQGMTFDGAVTGIRDFGVFVEIGPGCEGLVHVSELSHGRVSHPGDVAKVGDTMKVGVIGIDTARRRVELSRRAVLDDPWLGIGGSVRPGDAAVGEVKGAAGYGVFIELVEHGVVGLLHVSELGTLDPNDYRVGDRVAVRVAQLDLGKRRISFSLDK